MIAIMGIGAALATAMWWPREGGAGDSPATIDAVVARARTLAVARGERLALQMRDDGHWLLRAAAVNTPDTIASGFVASTEGTAAAGFAIEVDPLGSCQPAAGTALMDMRAFDLTRCRWLALPEGGAP